MHIPVGTLVFLVLAFFFLALDSKGRYGAVSAGAVILACLAYFAAPAVQAIVAKLGD